MKRPRLTVHDHVQGVSEAAWDGLLVQQAHPAPFVRHAYLSAMTDSGSATPDTGWTPRLFALWQPGADGGEGEGAMTQHRRIVPFTSAAAGRGRFVGILPASGHSGP